MEIPERFEQGLAPGASSVNIWCSGEWWIESFPLWAAGKGPGLLSALRRTPFPPQVSRPGGAAVRLGLTFQPAPKAWPAFQKIKRRYLPVI